MLPANDLCHMQKVSELIGDMLFLLRKEGTDVTSSYIYALQLKEMTFIYDLRRRPSRLGFPSGLACTDREF